MGETLKHLCSPTLEKALTFLDDKLLPSTSNAVERGNRRYRKRQKSVYRVRTRTRRSGRVLRSLGGVKPTPKAGNTPLPHFILRELDKPGSSATVSKYEDVSPLLMLVRV